MLRPTLLFLLGLSAASLTAAGPVVVEIFPHDVVLIGPGASQQLLVTAVDEHGFASDVTESCAWRSSAPEVISMEGARAVARTAGEVTVSVDCGGVKTSARITAGSAETAEMEVDFGGDLLSILTTKGCNSSACHGSPAGQSGFKLSLYGADPEADHRMIVSEADGRRVDLSAPEKSLVLQKPTFQIAHGGGHLMTPDSDEYRIILNWLRQGAKYDSSGARLERLEIYPPERILVGQGARQRFTVVGRLSDGTTREMTDRVRFQVNDEGIVSAVEDGVVAAKSRGLTTVLARAMGKTASAELIVIDEAAGSDYPNVQAANFIDEYVFRKLRQVNVRSFAPTSDRAFVRRVYLDVIGMLPPPDETEAFVADARSDKRERLIDELLGRNEYATNWLVKFEDWFRNSQYYSQGRTNGSYKRWLLELIREDRPYDETVHEMLTATGDTTVYPAGNFWHPAIDFMLKEFQINKATPTVTRLFLGRRIECAECHNHPLENLTQDDFFGMAAFLAQTNVKHGYGQYRRIWYDGRRGEFPHPTTGKPVPPKFLGGEVAEIPEGKTRREVLADWITKDQRMQFARATVNRVWYEYFGRGIVEPFDDFRSTNRPTHPALLDALAEHFISNGFRFKALHRVILASKTYQLSAHEPGRPGGLEPLEDVLFARHVPRKLPAETLLDAVVQVTGVPHRFGDYPEGTSPKELVASIGAPYFLEVFDFPKRDVLEPRTQSPSMAQALHMMNGDTLADKLEADDNVLGKMISRGAADAEILEELYLRAYARAPEAYERDRMATFLAQEQSRGRSRRRALENALWAILNSKEFLLNR